MSLYDELIQKWLYDLQNGLVYNARNSSGDWEQKTISYQDLLKSYCSATVIRNVFLAKYKKMKPIEDFPTEEKSEWKKFVNEIFPGTQPQFRLEAVKIIYTIGVLTNE